MTDFRGKSISLYDHVCTVKGDGLLVGVDVVTYSIPIFYVYIIGMGIIARPEVFAL